MGFLEWRMSGVMSGEFARDPEFKTEGDFDTNLNEELETLKRIAKNKPETLAQVQDMADLSLAEAEILRNFPSLDPADVNMETQKSLSKTAMGITVKHTELRKILQDGFEQLKSMRSSQDTSLVNLLNVVNTAATVALLICAGIVFGFSQTFSKRLESLAQKARRLSEHQPLTNVLKGNDELGYLDEVLTRTSELLSEAAEHRRSILSMVAHDMRSPLMASKASIEIIEQSDKGFAQSSKDLLDRASTRLTEILKQLNELLEIQKTADDSLFASQSFQALQDPELEKKQTFVQKSKEFFTRPGIFQKSLMLVTVPILIQASLIIQIQLQIAEIQRVTKMERMFSDINIINNLLRNDLVRGSSLYLVYVVSGSAKARTKANDIFAHTEDLFHQLYEAASGDKQWTLAIKEAHDWRMQQISDLQTLRSGDEPERIQQVLMSADQPPESTETRKSLTDSEIMSRGFTREIKQAQLNLRKAKNNLDQTFLIAMLLNILLPGLALFIFNRDISGRLKMLMSNAASLKDGQALPNTIKGSDEIAYLGQVLWKSQKELDHSSRERSKIMNSIANEMRAPLTFAEQCLQEFAASDDGRSEATVSRQLERAQRNITRVSALIDDLLSMETLEAGKVNLVKSEFDLHGMVDSALAAVASLAKKKDIELVNSSASVSMVADKDRLIQVLVNLLSNALKFSANDTKITISSELENGAIKVLVTDQGPGMDKETRERVFEKYFQAETAAKKEGFGLGLAICNLIVQSHKGNLGVESEPGKGSTFWFSIPN
jgi:signal transduction histidine kinase